MAQTSEQGPEIEGFVLVGGASSRMGENKARLEIGGLSMSERASSTLKAVCKPPVTLVGEGSEMAAIGVRAIPDGRANTCDLPRAPIFGLSTALVNASTPWIAVLACDLPFVTGDLVYKLSGFCTEAVDAVVPVQPDARPQPLCAFYRVEKCRPIAEMMIAAGDLKLQNLLAKFRTRYVQFEEIGDLSGSEAFFINVNTPEDYARAVKLARP